MEGMYTGGAGLEGMKQLDFDAGSPGSLNTGFDFICELDFTAL